MRRACSTENDPEYGYYQTRDPLGVQGDFITSPEISQIFGEIIGLWCVVTWQNAGRPGNTMLVELGPGRGTLMADILKTAKKVAPEFINALKVHLIETSPVLKQQQKAVLKDYEIKWYDDIETIPSGPALIIANEFFDALPFNRYLKDGESIKELFVKFDNGKLFEVKKEVKDFKFLSNDITSKIPGGSTFEVIKDLDLICKKLSSLFNYCVMITIDYGYDDYNKLFFKNPNGLVRCYFNHSMDKNILENIGKKDITCDVNFNYLNESLNKYGFYKIGNTSQEKFLIENGFRTFFDNSKNEEEKRNLISLINPDGMGGFHVYFHEKPNTNFLPGCLKN